MNVKHQKANTRLYTIWKNMNYRCRNPHHTTFHNYGGRGITVCDEWKNNFEAFYEWAVENGYSDDLTLDRIDVNGNYEPSNCRWATKKVQAENRRVEILIDFNGEQLSLLELAKRHGLKPKTVRKRYERGKRGDDLVKPARGTTTE